LKSARTLAGGFGVANIRSASALPLMNASGLLVDSVMLSILPSLGLVSTRRRKLPSHYGYVVNLAVDDE